MSSKELMTVQEFANELECSGSGIYSRMSKGTIKYKIVREGLREVKMIPRSELEKFKKI